jgi:uncharacterized protein (DUF169 family)
MHEIADSQIYREYGEELEKRIRLKTFPLAVKLLAEEGDIPREAQRPLRDLGYHLSLCQGYQISRREGMAIAMLAEDMWCFEPVVGYGLAEPPAYFMEGHNRFPQDVETLEAGRHYAAEFPRLQVGKYVGVVAAPLKTASFEPDLVMIYCDSAQLGLLLLGREYKEGYNLKCALSSHAACVYAVVPAMLSGRCQVAVPCRGDHYAAMAGDDEMIFTVPRGELGDLMAGLRHVEKSGSRLPRGYRLHPEYPQSESYEKIAKIMGYR